MCNCFREQCGFCNCDGADYEEEEKNYGFEECPDCDGTGFVDGVSDFDDPQCPTCRGAGRIK